MWCLTWILALTLTNVIGLPTTPERIVGGTLTSIREYPFAVAMLDYFWNYGQNCAGTIITDGSVLTAAHCVYQSQPVLWRVRVGSSFGNSGGTVYNLDSIVIHPQYNRTISNNDFAILKITGQFEYNSYVQKGRLSGANYPLGDNQLVTAIGWGTLWSGGPSSEQLRHVQYWTVNRELCRERYTNRNPLYQITESMLCAGWLDVGGRDQCQGDSGGPLIHNGVVVGVCSFGEGCALGELPGINALVSAAAEWIRVTA